MNNGVTWIVGVAAVLAALFFLYTAQQGRKEDPLSTCNPKVEWVSVGQDGVCLLTCWGGSIDGGPAITWVPSSVCGR